MILGTAGHVDHGKTALVLALTGVDTDRLAEEKRRGITIDLGFAPLALGAVTLGVVDVPGHEAFVRNMLAGATGIDLALLVIAADEGVMPQTREHLHILTLLGVRDGVVALTKRDLVDEEWAALVTEDVRQSLEGTPLADAEIIETSVVAGQGLVELRDALARAAARVPQRAMDDLFRLPVDRAFTVKGTGTVVTGTVWSGSVAREATVSLWPGGARCAFAASSRTGSGWTSRTPECAPRSRLEASMSRKRNAEPCWSRTRVGLPPERCLQRSHCFREARSIRAADPRSPAFRDGGEHGEGSRRGRAATFWRAAIRPRRSRSAAGCACRRSIRSAERIAAHDHWRRGDR